MSWEELDGDNMPIIILAGVIISVVVTLWLTGCNRHPFHAAPALWY